MEAWAKPGGRDFHSIGDTPSRAQGAAIKRGWQLLQGVRLPEMHPQGCTVPEPPPQGLEDIVRA